jgi:hypothetical protein
VVWKATGKKSMKLFKKIKEKLCNGWATVDDITVGLG